MDCCFGENMHSCMTRHRAQEGTTLAISPTKSDEHPPNMQKPEQSFVSPFSKVGVRGGEERLRRVSFLCALLASALLVGVNAPASAESDQWIQCQGGDDEARIISCTQVIERGKREANRERVSAL